MGLFAPGASRVSIAHPRGERKCPTGAAPHAVSGEKNRDSSRARQLRRAGMTKEGVVECTKSVASARPHPRVTIPATKERRNHAAPPLPVGEGIRMRFRKSPRADPRACRELTEGTPAASVRGETKSRVNPSERPASRGIPGSYAKSLPVCAFSNPPTDARWTARDPSRRRSG